MAEETVFRRDRLSGILVSAMAGRGKQYTGVPLVRTVLVNPSGSMVPGPVRKSLVKPQTAVWRLSRLEYRLSRTTWAACRPWPSPVTEEVPCPEADHHPLDPSHPTC
jgi:hypothetical protein